MITNKEYADLMVKSGVFDEGMRKYFENDTLYAVKLSAGIMQVSKPHLETRFCYGWGQCGSIDSASASCDVVSSDYNFFLSENLEQLKKELDILENRPETVYLVKSYRIGNVVSWRGGGNYWNREKDAIDATAEDIEIIKESIKKKIENLTKRCATYWKRFGGSKLKTWTYWADE